jgi:hypothetical protein
MSTVVAFLDAVTDVVVSSTLTVAGLFTPQGFEHLNGAA